MKLVYRYQSVLIFCVTLVLLIVLALYGVKPLLGYSFSLFNEKRMVSYQLDGLEQRMGMADSLLQHNYKIWDKIQAVKKSVPTTGKASYILDQLLANARSKDLKITDIYSLAELEHNDFIEYPFELQLDGYFLPLQNYLIGLENLDMVVNLRSISIRTVKINFANVTADLQLSVFILKKSQNTQAYSPRLSDSTEVELHEEIDTLKMIQIQDTLTKDSVGGAVHE